MYRVELPSNGGRGTTHTHSGGVQGKEGAVLPEVSGPLKKDSRARQSTWTWSSGREQDGERGCCSPEIPEREDRGEERQELWQEAQVKTVSHSREAAVPKPTGSGRSQRPWNSPGSLQTRDKLLLFACLTHWPATCSHHPPSLKAQAAFRPPRPRWPQLMRPQSCTTSCPSSHHPAGVEAEGTGRRHGGMVNSAHKT